MSWFNKRSKKFKITIDDKNWVDETLLWLVKCNSIPSSTELVDFSEKYFPNTFGSSKISVADIVKDSLRYLGLHDIDYSIQYHEDLRDTSGIAYESGKEIFESDLAKIGNHYQIHIATSLERNPPRLAYRVILETVKIKMLTIDESFYDSENFNLTAHIAAIYFGLGLIVVNYSRDIGNLNDGVWESSWSLFSEVPDEVLVYALVSYCNLCKLDPNLLSDNLNSHFRQIFENARLYLEQNPSQVLNETNLLVAKLFFESNELYLKNQFDKAIEVLRKILFIHSGHGSLNNWELAEVYNNIGYYQLRNGEYFKSIDNFQKAINHDEDFGYARSNLGYSLLELNKLEEGKENILEAKQCPIHDLGYIHRGLALYYQKKNEFQEAEKQYKKAFELKTNEVDLLELNYCKLLFVLGDKDNGLKYLKIAVEKNEPEAIAYRASLSF